MNATVMPEGALNTGDSLVRSYPVGVMRRILLLQGLSTYPERALAPAQTSWL